MKKQLLLIIPFFTYFLGNSQETKESLKEKISKAPKDKNLPVLYSSLAKLYKSENLDSSVYYCFEGLKIAKDFKDRNREALILAEIATCYNLHSNLFFAEKYAKEALSIFKELKDEKLIASIEMELGVIEGKRGNYLEATKLFFNALTIFKKHNQTSKIAQAYLKLGVVNEMTNNYDKALEYYNMSFDLVKNNTNDNTYYSLLNNIGIIYAKKGDFKVAISYFEKGVNANEAKDMAGVYITLLTNCMKAYIQIGNEHKAYEYHNMAVALVRKYKLPNEEARIYYNFAEANVDRTPVSAIEYFKKALIICDSIEEKQLASDIKEQLSIIYYKQGNFKEAFKSLYEHHQLKDSLLDIEKTKALSSMFANYEMNESKALINELTITNIRRTNERNIGIIITVGALFIIILIGFYLRKIKNLNNQLQDSNLIKDKLFSIIGHDLKSSAITVSEGMSLLEDSTLTKSDYDNVIRQIKKDAANSLDIVTSLLSWGETQIKGISLHQEKFNAQEIIDKNIAYKLDEAKQKQIKITNNITSSKNIFADKNHFDFIIRNILANAIKFTNINGNIEFDASENVNDSTITFSIKDSGKGISIEQQQNFINSNIDVTQGTKGENGTGLGLLLVKEFVRKNNGTITLHSKEGEGTTFFIQFKSE